MSARFDRIIVPSANEIGEILARFRGWSSMRSFKISTGFLVSSLTFTWGLTANAQGISISVGAGTAVAGSTVSLPVMISGGSAPAAIQWSVSYGVTDLRTVSASAGPVALAANKSITCNSYPGKLICVAAGLNNTA